MSRQALMIQQIQRTLFQTAKPTLRQVLRVARSHKSVGLVAEATVVIPAVLGEVAMVAEVAEAVVVAEPAAVVPAVPWRIC